MTEFKRAYMAEPEVLRDALGGRYPHPDIFTLEPQGNRIHVILDPVPEQIGLIKLPQEYVNNERMGAGVVAAVGPEVGQAIPYPGGPVMANPGELLYAHVIFGAHVGKPLRLEFLRDHEFNSGAVVMADRDVWAVEWTENLARVPEGWGRTQLIEE